MSLRKNGSLRSSTLLAREAKARSALACAISSLEPRRLLAAFTVDPSPPSPDAFTFPTISEALGAAAGTSETDDTINVVAGTFSEQVTLSTPVTLLGARAGQDPRAALVGSASVIAGQITIASPGVTVDGFTFSGGAAGTSSPTLSAIHVTDAQAVIRNNVFTGTSTGSAIFTESTAPDATLTASRNLVNGWSTGLDARLAGALTVSDNIFDGNEIGINIRGSATAATVSSNSIINSTTAGVAIDLATDAGAAAVTLDANTLNNPGVPQLKLDGGTAGEDLVTLSGNAVTLAGPATFITSTAPTPIAGRSANTFTLPRDATEDQAATFDLSLIDGSNVAVTTNGLAGNAHASGTSVAYTPSSDFNGATSFEFTTADGASGTVALIVASVNDAPTGSNIPHQSLLENASIVLPLSNYFSDIDADDALTYSLITPHSWITLVAATGALTIAPQIGDAGPYTVTVSASDGDVSASQSFTLDVIRAVNQSPVFGSIPATINLAENVVTPVFDVNATDPDDDGLMFSIVAGNSAGKFAIDPATGVVTLAGTLDAEQAQSYALTIRATDDGEPAPATTDAVLNVHVTDANDVATTVAIVGPTPTNPVEGQSVSFAANAVDGDVDATLSYRWFVDGVERTGETSSTFTTTFADEGDHLVRVEVSDRGDPPAIASQDVHISDAPPVIPLSTSVSAVNEGASFTLNVGTITDVDPSDLAGIGQLSVNWGDGQYTVINSETDAASLAAIRAGTPIAISHAYDDGSNLDRTIMVRLYDDSSRSFTASRSIRVNNLAPTGTFAAITPTISAGSPAFVNWFGTNDISAADRLAGLRYTYAIDVNNNGLLDPADTFVFGDGTYAGSSSLSQVTIPNTFVSNPGTYHILSQLIDKDGSPVLTRVVDVVVTTGTFRVVSIGGDHSGFTINFNRAVDRAPLNLWDGTDTAVDTADVVLTRANGQVVRGSLVFNSAGTGFDFIVTGGILSAGNYTVTLRSGNNAFQAIDGSDLDGDDNGTAGGTYTAIFGVNAPPGPVLSVADFSRGPGQPIDVIPEQPSSDLPILMTSPISVSSLNFQIRYSAALMNVSNVYAGSGLPQGWQVDWSLGAGVINVSLMKTTPTTANLSAGFRELIKITASVPNDPSIYGKSQILSFASIVVNGDGSLEGTADRALHKVVYLGDANFDGNVNIGDAGLIQSVVLQNVTGFDTYPLVDPAIIVDSSRNLAVDAQDATNVALSGFTGGRPAVVPDFTPLTLAGSLGVDPTYGLPAHFGADSGATIQVPVSVIDDARGIQSGAIRISYDPSVLILSGQPVVAASLLAAGWTILSNVNAAEGWIEVAFYKNTALAGTSPLTGALFTLQFQVAANAAEGSTPLTIAGASNTSTSPTILFDRAGHILATGAVSGAVLIDTQSPTAQPGVFSFSGSRQSIAVVFSEDVRESISASDFELMNLTTNTLVQLVVDSISADGRTITLTFAATGGVTSSILTDGNYHFRVIAAGITDLVGHPLTAQVTSDFFFVNGDANHDRVVNFDDLVLLAQNYNTTTGVSFAKADLNYDGFVNFDDLVILAQRYGRSLEASPPPSPIRTSEPKRRGGAVQTISSLQG